MSVLNTINEKESKDTNRLSLNKLEGGKSFKITSNFKPSGDQPAAIKELCQGLNDKQKNQVLLGVTGSGKTFTMAKIIESLNRPALILAPNKTLAAQLYGEMKSFFLKTQSNILSLIMIIILLKLTCQDQIHILKKSHQSTNKSIE